MPLSHRPTRQLSCAAPLGCLCRLAVSFSRTARPFFVGSPPPLSPPPHNAKLFPNRLWFKPVGHTDSAGLETRDGLLERQVRLPLEPVRRAAPIISGPEPGSTVSVPICQSGIWCGLPCLGCGGWSIFVGAFVCRAGGRAAGVAPRHVKAVRARRTPKLRHERTRRRAHEWHGRPAHGFIPKHGQDARATHERGAERRDSN